MAAVAAAAITAAVAAGTTAYSASQASKASGQAARAAGKQKQIPLPGYATALNKDVARVIALNMGQTPPSFASYVASGGTAKFPFIDPGLDPTQLRQLGLVGPGNTPVPFEPRSDAAAGKPLTLDQIMFIGRKRLQKGFTNSPAAQLAMTQNKLERLQTKDQTPRVQRREQKATARVGRLKTKLGVDNGSGD